MEDYSDPPRFQEEPEEIDRCGWFSEKTKPRYLLPFYLDELETAVETSVFDSPRQCGAIHLARLTQEFSEQGAFPNPKDHEVLMPWIQIASPKDAVALDFFGSSGTTAEAGIRLNAEDGGAKQSILPTNNELSAKDDAALRKTGHESGSAEYKTEGVFYHVIKPSIETVFFKLDGANRSLSGFGFGRLLWLVDPRRLRQRQGLWVTASDVPSMASMHVRWGVEPDPGVLVMDSGARPANSH